MNKTNKILTAIVAAAALGGCAKEAPVVAPAAAPILVYMQRDVINVQNDPETHDMMVSYITVTSDATTLAIAVYDELNSELYAKLSLERQEENGTCVMEKLQAVKAEGYNMVFEDVDCNGTVDTFYNRGERTNRSDFFNAEGVDAGFANLRGTIDSFFDIDFQIKQWRERNNQQRGN